MYIIVIIIGKYFYYFIIYILYNSSQFTSMGINLCYIVPWCVMLFVIIFYRNDMLAYYIHTYDRYIVIYLVLGLGIVNKNS